MMIKNSYYNTGNKVKGGSMAKFPDDRGEGVVEWILIVILALMVLVTIYLLLKPALANLVQQVLESIQ